MLALAAVRTRLRGKCHLNSQRLLPGKEMFQVPIPEQLGQVSELLWANMSPSLHPTVMTPDLVLLAETCLGRMEPSVRGCGAHLASSI